MLSGSCSTSDWPPVPESTCLRYTWGLRLPWRLELCSADKQVSLVCTGSSPAKMATEPRKPAVLLFPGSLLCDTLPEAVRPKATVFSLPVPQVSSGARLKSSFFSPPGTSFPWRFSSSLEDQVAMSVTALLRDTPAQRNNSAVSTAIWIEPELVKEKKWVDLSEYMPLIGQVGVT